MGHDGLSAVARTRIEHLLEQVEQHAVPSGPWSSATDYLRHPRSLAWHIRQIIAGDDEERVELDSPLVSDEVTWQAATPPGWWPLVHRLDEWLQNLLGGRYKLESVTDPDGRLELSLANPTALDPDLREAARILIAHTVAESERVCEICGSPAAFDRPHPLRARCDEHRTP